ncbi:ornithine cyclodeaminase family protein [Pelagibius litoralis]|uniref:Ornithine cyclodeaminase family protein n=1 Tax=Pelagibius litoralis TaxID=374515 RepID=A0A967EZB2_9PROT|nr:ornithine cyclodeaminase family protein [Pelagibius litoralis]NIA70180.1 ornithine cyclodeaminase family protein [Pelagibius litoralis]
MISLSRPQIEALIDHERAAELIEEAYRAVSLGKVNLPPVGHIVFPEHDGDCHIKYGHVEGDPVFVIKVATGFENNAALGLPTGNGLSLVLSAKTGAVRAVLHDEMCMTDIRTAIGGAIATRLLIREESRRIVIVGTGVQARRQVEAHLKLMAGRDLEFLVWGRSAEKTTEAVVELSEAFPSVQAAADLEQACRQADVIVTTTAARRPIVQRDWVQPGTHITAVGADAPGKQELETDLVASADGLFVDLRPQCLDHGEVSTAARAELIGPDSLAELGEVLAGEKPGRAKDEDITIADLTGLAVQDIAMARIVLSAFEAHES